MSERASANTVVKKTGASNAAGRASASTTTIGRVQPMSRGEHLLTQPSKILLQAMQRSGHLRVQSYKEELQGLPAEGRLVLVSRTEEL